MAIKFIKSLQGAYKEIICMVLVNSDLLNYTEFHLLTNFFDRAQLEEVCDGDFTFQVLEIFTLVDEVVSQVKIELWPTNHHRITTELSVDWFH